MKERALGNITLWGNITGETSLRTDLLGLHAFLALNGHKRDFLTFLEGFEPLTFDGAEMHEQIRAFLRGDETKAFSFVEPFDGSSLTI